MENYKINLIRCARTYNTQCNKKYVGQLDMPAAKEGLEEIENLKNNKHYPKVMAVYSSPLKRCIQTAKILYPNNQLIIFDNFKDMNLGDFAGKSFDELKNNDIFISWLNNSNTANIPNGETTQEFVMRIIDAFDNLLKIMMQEKLNNIALITHGGVIMSLLAALGIPQAPIQQWATNNGEGYTVFVNAMLWMRYNKIEVNSIIPKSESEL